MDGARAFSRRGVALHQCEGRDLYLIIRKVKVKVKPVLLLPPITQALAPSATNLPAGSLNGPHATGTGTVTEGTGRRLLERRTVAKTGQLWGRGPQSAT